MAIAVNNNAVGSTKTHVYSRADYVIEPNVPAFVALGDSFDMAVTVTNNANKGQSGKVSLSLNVNPSVQLNSQKTLVATIAPHLNHTYHFKLRAGQSPGKSKLSFIATNGVKTSKSSIGLSIRPPSLYEFKLLSGFSKKETNTFDIKQDFYSQHRSMSVAAGYSADLLVNGLLEKIAHAPIANNSILSAKLLAKVNSHPRNTIIGNQLKTTQNLNQQNNAEILCKNDYALSF